MYIINQDSKNQCTWIKMVLVHLLKHVYNYKLIKN